MLTVASGRRRQRAFGRPFLNAGQIARAGIERC